MRKLTPKQKLVYDTISEYPGCQNDEMLLVAKIWERSGWDSSKGLYENLKHMTHPETISRRRRELYNMGLITYSQEAEKVREDAYIKERDQYSAVSWLYDE